MAELGADHCFLDATMLADAEAIGAHFPTFVAACRAAGISPDRDWVPVSPTTHYTMGGVLTDTEGRTTLEGLMAVGEVGCNGLHGANRLASNSLLEGAVIGRRAARPSWRPAARLRPGRPCPSRRRCSRRPAWLRLATVSQPAARPRHAAPGGPEAGAGVARDAGGPGAPGQLPGRRSSHRPDRRAEAWELANMALVARVVVALAARRRESRGAHWRTDYPPAARVAGPPGRPATDADGRSRRLPWAPVPWGHGHRGGGCPTAAAV